MKKIISVLMCLTILVLTVSSIGSGVSAYSSTVGTDIPTIYVGGQGETIYDKDGNKIYPFDISMDIIKEELEPIINSYSKGLFFNDWDSFLDKVYEICLKFLGPVALDENGDVSDGSYARFSWKKEELDGQKVNGYYPLDRYYFEYDWRVDPFDIARELHSYIEDVLEVTGETKVEMIGRCLGASVAEAYMYLYDGEYIDSYLQYASGSQGVMIMSNSFAGTLGLYPDSIDRFIVDNGKLNLEGATFDLVSSIVTILNKTNILDAVCLMFNKTYQNIYMDIIPRLVGETFATMPGYWSMVEDEYYEKAKEVSLYSRGYTEDSRLVRRIDDYHYNVQQKIGDIFEKMKTEKGITISNITKYGKVSYFFFEESKYLNDETARISCTSYGATTSTVTGILSPFYLLKKTIENDTKYISPDLKIDASTCLNPDTTYFIKNLTHTDFPKSVEPYIVRILNNNDCTVDTYDDFPQYSVYINKKIEPMTKENMFTDKAYYTSLTKSVITLFSTLFELAKNN